jgi:hypothetical protein
VEVENIIPEMRPIYVRQWVKRVLENNEELEEENKEQEE